MSTLAAAHCRFPCKLKLPRDAAYSLFGGPFILDVGPTVNGEIIHVRVQPINTISVTALVISVLLFVAFMCFYLYPLFRMRRQRTQTVNKSSRDVEFGPPEEADKRSLMFWLYSRSRDRFSTHDSPKPKATSHTPSLRYQTSTIRGSLIPDMSTPNLTPPPPAYASRPSSPLATEYQILSRPMTSPGSPRSMTRDIFPTRNLNNLAVRPFMGPRSVSASTLHPSDAQRHRPSRARVYSAGDTSRKSPSRVQHSGGSGLTPSLASQGRQLTRAPSFDVNTRTTVSTITMDTEISTESQMATFRPPFTETALETSRVKLEVFSPAVHSEAFFSIVGAHHGLLRYFAIDFTPEILETFLADPGTILFAIIDKTRQDSFAGIIGLLHTSFANLSTEIGPVVIFPDFQRTFVASNAIGLVMRYCLNLPSDGGLGFRRVQWTANEENTASLRAAERMGMKVEGVMRWNWVLPPGREGKQVSNGRGAGLGRHSVLLAVCWDDWENGGKELVDKIVERKS
ncbi:N-acetyltransferase domain-containing protein [Mycena indigotica]|uniref:N-acetyltransferase domain-containing protein n=1 Tax=Mycena indigotica TaxID=2126181 RepID=A0A8H6WD98_9AGAR|nr:N-acetyltransferase domain-containing protein [Mycena indigotica]KAF7312271.1 N-acetyltransferase domain-containing protein [Mycena indigotica]